MLFSKICRKGMKTPTFQGPRGTPWEGSPHGAHSVHPASLPSCWGCTSWGPQLLLGEEVWRLPHPLSATLGVQGSLSLQSFPAQPQAFPPLWLPSRGTLSPLWGKYCPLSLLKTKAQPPPPCFSGLSVPGGGWGLSSPGHTNPQMLMLLLHPETPPYF